MKPWCESLDVNWWWSGEVIIKTATHDLIPSVHEEHSIKGEHQWRNVTRYGIKRRPNCQKTDPWGATTTSLNNKQFFFYGQVFVEPGTAGTEELPPIGYCEVRKCGSSLH